MTYVSAGRLLARDNNERGKATNKSKRALAKSVGSKASLSINVVRQQCRSLQGRWAKGAEGASLMGSCTRGEDYPATGGAHPHLQNAASQGKGGQTKDRGKKNGEWTMIWRRQVRDLEV
jgi:hypothetical protein